MIWTSPIFCNRFNFQETISFYELFKLLPHCPASGCVIFFSSSLYSSYRSLSDIRTLSWLLFPPLILCIIVYNYILYKLIQCVNAGNIRAPLRNFARRSYLYRHLSVLTETTNRIGKIDNDRIRYRLFNFTEEIFLLRILPVTILERFTFVLTATKWSTLLQCTNNALL